MRVSSLGGGKRLGKRQIKNIRGHERDKVLADSIVDSNRKPTHDHREISPEDPPTGQWVPQMP